MSELTGRKLDVEVAEKVMGWKNVRDSDGWGHWTGDAPDGYEDNFNRAAHTEGSLPYYSSDIAVAWLVVEEMRRRGCALALEDWRDDYRLVTNGWCALFTLSDGHDTGHFIAETAPLVICRAALAALAAAGGAGG